jgi:hypothetical protein
MSDNPKPLNIIDIDFNTALEETIKEVEGEELYNELKKPEQNSGFSLGTFTNFGPKPNVSEEDAELARKKRLLTELLIKIERNRAEAQNSQSLPQSGDGNNAEGNGDNNGNGLPFGLGGHPGIAAMELKFAEIQKQTDKDLLENELANFHPRIADLRRLQEEQKKMKQDPNYQPAIEIPPEQVPFLSKFTGEQPKQQPDVFAMAQSMNIGGATFDIPRQEQEQAQASEQSRPEQTAAPTPQQSASEPPSPPPKPPPPVLTPLPPTPSDVPPITYKTDIVTEDDYVKKYKTVIEGSVIKDPESLKDTSAFRTIWTFLRTTVVGRFILVAIFLVVVFITLVVVQGFSKLGMMQMFSVGILFLIVNTVILIFFISKNF